MILTVNTKPSYPLYLGNGLFKNINDYLSGNYHQIAILLDSKFYDSVNSLYKQFLLIPLDLSHDKKDLRSYEKVIKQLELHNFSRDDLLINIGGGTICDIGGFVAATYKRGIDFINVPTTTLAQIDAATGGKNGLDSMNIRNLLGCFYQPTKVIIDFDFLKTLPQRHYYNGLYEALKIALLFDNQLFQQLENFRQENIYEICKTSLLHKISIVEQDEHDNGIRKTLNFGHTIAHALEGSLKDKDLLYHGEAVLYGMCMMIEDANIRHRVREIALSWNIPSLPGIDFTNLAMILQNDKKVREEMFSCVILNDLQDFEIKELNLNQLILRAKDYEQSIRTTT